LVDFALGDHEVAIEVKSTPLAKPKHLSGLKRFAEEYPVKKQILVSNDEYPRLVDGIHVLPWKEFLERLWGGEVVG